MYTIEKHAYIIKKRDYIVTFLDRINQTVPPEPRK